MENYVYVFKRLPYTSRVAERRVKDKWRREFKILYSLSMAFMMKPIMTENVMLVSVPIK